VSWPAVRGRLVGAGAADVEMSERGGSILVTFVVQVPHGYRSTYSVRFPAVEVDEASVAKMHARQKNPKQGMVAKTMGQCRAEILEGKMAARWSEVRDFFDCRLDWVACGWETLDQSFHAYLQQREVGPHTFPIEDAEVVDDEAP
jgi:hypothetical protein